MSMKRALGALVLLVLVTACGAGPQAPAGAGAAGSADTLAFTATTVGGEPFQGTSLAGKPAVLWFWAPWCTKCQREAAGIADAASQSEVTFIGVAANDTVAEMRGFIDQRGVGGFEHLADEQAEIWKHFGVAAQPAYAFITSTGQVEVVTRQLGHDELMAKVDALT